MTHDLSHPSLHPAGEQPPVEGKGPPQGVSLDSFTGPVHVEWDTGAALTPLGQLPFFIDFLKAGGLFDAFVADCPLHYTSPNAPKKRDVLGTAMLSMLSGHKRYAHIAALRCDSVLPELLGMNKIVSEDAVRRAFAAIDEDEGAAWLRRHLDYCTSPLLAEPWILDIDTTVKPLYGHQEGAVAGLHRAAYRLRRLQQGAQIGAPRLVYGGGHGDDEEVGLAKDLEIISVTHRRTAQFVGAKFARAVVMGFKFRNPLPRNIEPDHWKTGSREGNGYRQSNVTEADDRDARNVQNELACNDAAQGAPSQPPVPSPSPLRSGAVSPVLKARQTMAAWLFYHAIFGWTTREGR